MFFEPGAGEGAGFGLTGAGFLGGSFGGCTTTGAGL